MWKFKNREPESHIWIELSILRRENAQASPYWQNILYETDNLQETVASALTVINESGEFLDTGGNKVEPIRWQCSCLQKKCGACAMIIDGRPGLACGARLKDYAGKKKLKIEPFRKFPVIADLMVDRSILFENLKTLKLWREESISLSDSSTETAYETSRCLQCGCCLEVCPNYSISEEFFGAAGFVPTIRLLTSLTGAEQKKIKESYLKHSYSGCGKSLACASVCPAEIEIEKLLVNTNGAVFRK